MQRQPRLWWPQQQVLHRLPEHLRRTSGRRALPGRERPGTAGRQTGQQPWPSCRSLRQPAWPATPRGIRDRPVSGPASASRTRPSMTPPLITRSGFALANSRRPFAAAATSPRMKAIAVGPVRESSSPSMPACLAARMVSVFLRHGVGGVLTQGPAEFLQVLDGEPAVLGQYGCRRGAERIAQLRNGGCLVRPRHGSPSQLLLGSPEDRWKGKSPRCAGQPGRTLRD